jgi:plastocyanin
MRAFGLHGHRPLVMIGAAALAAVQLGGSAGITVAASPPAGSPPAGSPPAASAPAESPPPSGGPLIIQADQPAAAPGYHNWAFDDFFPRALTVAQGSTIGFMIEGFHTATLLPTGTTAAQDEATSGVAAADADDTTPNPNGTPHTGFSIPAISPSPANGCGTGADPCAFDGSSVVSSGAPLAAPPTGPFMVTVTAQPGQYAFHCRIHPQMTGTLTVVAAGGQSTSQTDLTAAVNKQVADDVAAGTAAEAAANAAGRKVNADGTITWTVTAGTSSPDGHTVILEMLPVSLSIKPGDTVRFEPKGSNEVHTITFPGELHSDTVPLCENGATDTPAVPKVNPPQSPFDFACGSGPPDEVEFGGGNGVTSIDSPTTVADSGLIGDPGVASAMGIDKGLLDSWQVKFTKTAKPGLYTFVCQIHNNMQGTIIIPESRP